MRLHKSFIYLNTEKGIQQTGGNFHRFGTQSVTIEGQSRVWDFVQSARKGVTETEIPFPGGIGMPDLKQVLRRRFPKYEKKIWRVRSWR